MKKKLNWIGLAIAGTLAIPGIGAAAVRADDGGPLNPSSGGGSFPAPQLIQLPSDGLFVPQGFDDNDSAQVVVHGHLINTCYKAAPPSVQVDTARRLITVTTHAYAYTGCWCLQVLVPFTQAIDLGVLPAGNYRVVEYNTTGRLIHDETLPVRPAPSAAPDDFLYAPVKQARVDLGAAGSPKTLVLEGTFTSDCMELQEIKVLQRSPHIIEVLPIAAYSTSASCTERQRAFSAQVKLPPVEPGDTLIYVRSLNGQAISLVEPF